jgi:hypothetical protein
MTAGALHGLLGAIGAGVFQQAWIVEDLASAEDAMRRALGCSEFVDLRMDQQWSYQGRSVPCTLALGFARSGNVQIELMQPLGGEGVHVEFLERHGSGPHHLGCLVDDLDEAVEIATANGFHQVMATDFGPVRLCYLDTYETVGLYLEVIEDPGDVLMSFMPWRDDPAT